MLVEDYQNVVALLHRIELKGINEAHALVALEQKLVARIKALTHPTVAAPTPAAPTAPTEVTQNG